MRAEDWSDSQVFLIMLGSLLETENPLDPSAMPPNAPTSTFLPCPGFSAFLGYPYLSFYLGNLSFSHLLASDVLTSASAERSAGHISRLLKALAAVLKRKYLGFSGSSLAWPQRLPSSFCPAQAPHLFFH